ncbi:MAG: hypothetical protein F4187_04385 [Gemmatimonadetes bacterium]|nr:hypothetical protein [Gemmatimonadota bacterium]
MHECPDYVVKSQRWLFDGNGSLLEFTEERCELTREFTRTTVTRYGLEGGIWILKADGGKEVTETEQMCAYGENGVCGEWNAAGVPEWMPSE